jgi:hypothetical protein
MFKSLGHWFRQSFGLSKHDKAAIAMSDQTLSNNQITESFDAMDAPSHLVPYDENLLERARSQRQFGDWHSLAMPSKGRASNPGNLPAWPKTGVAAKNSLAKY